MIERQAGAVAQDLRARQRVRPTLRPPACRRRCAASRRRRRASTARWSSGSGSGSVTSSAARIRPARTRRDERVGVDDRPAAGVDEQRALLHARDHLARRRARASSGERGEHDHDVGAATASASRSTGSTPGRARRADAPDAHAEGRQPPLDRAADRAVADDHDALARQLARLPALPARAAAAAASARWKPIRSARIAATTHCATPGERVSPALQSVTPLGHVVLDPVDAGGERPARRAGRAAPQSRSRPSPPGPAPRTRRRPARRTSSSTSSGRPPRGEAVRDRRPSSHERAAHESPAGPATAPASSSRSISSGA